MKITLFTLLFCCLLSGHSMAANSPLWSKHQTSSTLAKKSAGFQASQAELTALFENKQQPVQVDIPLPTGEVASYLLTPSPVMAPALAKKFPELMAYRGEQLGTPQNFGRFDISPAGLSGLFKHNGRWVFLSPQQGRHISYYREDAHQDHDALHAAQDMMHLPHTHDHAPQPDLRQRDSGDTIKTYRLALSTTFEYTNFHGGLSGAMSALNTLVNRMNQILLVDLSIQFELVANNDLLIITDAADDTFTNDNPNDDIGANQTFVDNTIGVDNYDIGHVLAAPINGGGLAFVGVVCDPPIFGGGFKAQGYSGSSVPDGESFHVDLVLHELGHQLGANHTFNALGQGACQADQFSSESSVEPGSGSTIMSYAGICDSSSTGQNLQTFASPFFHAASIRQIRDVLEDSSIASCGTVSDIDNAIPQIDLTSSNFTIPANTPFLLTAETSDLDGDPLTHSWEQVDTSGLSGTTANREEMNQDNGENPLFRVFDPVESTTRYFPRLADVLAGTLTNGETFPTTTRSMNFELVVRDNRGGVATEQVQVNTTANSGGFSVTGPAPSSVLTGGQLQAVTWNTANSESSPINCAAVDVLMDVDGDETFAPIASAITNSGSAEVLIPNTASDQARLMIQCSDNIFYAVSEGEFRIVAGGEPVAPVITGQADVQIPEDGSYQIVLEDLTVNDPDTVFPDGFTLTVSPGNNYSAQNNLVSPDANFNGSLAVDIVINDGIADSPVFQFNILVLPVNDDPVAVDDALTVEQDSGATTIDVLANDSDVDNDGLTISAFDYTGAGTVSISDGQINYTPAAGFSGSDTLSYTIDDGNNGQASATVRIQVNAQAPPPTPTPPNNSGGGGGGSLAWLLGLLVLSMYRFKRLPID